MEARNGWELPNSSSRSSHVWKGILSMKVNFTTQVKFKVGSGDSIFFRHDIWVEQRVHSLFNFQICTVVLQIVRPWLGITWTKMIGSFYGIFKRYLLESEETNLFALLDTLQQVYIPERGKIAGCGLHPGMENFQCHLFLRLYPLAPLKILIGSVFGSLRLLLESSPLLG